MNYSELKARRGESKKIPPIPRRAKVIARRKKSVAKMAQRIASIPASSGHVHSCVSPEMFITTIREIVSEFKNTVRLDRELIVAQHQVIQRFIKKMNDDDFTLIEKDEDVRVSDENESCASDFTDEELTEIERRNKKIKEELEESSSQLPPVLSPTWSELGIIDATNLEDVHDRIQEGFQPAVFTELADKLGVSDRSLANKLNLSYTTLHRRKKGNVFTAAESEKVFHIVEILKKAIETFQDEELAVEWLKSPAPEFEGKIPLDLAATTTIGKNKVIHELNKKMNWTYV